MRIALVTGLALLVAPAAGDAGYLPSLNHARSSDTSLGSPTQIGTINFHLQDLACSTAAGDVWSHCLCDGAALLEAMRGTDKQAGKFLTSQPGILHTPFHKPSDLATWFWRPESQNEGTDLDTYWGISYVLQSLGVSNNTVTQGGFNEVVALQHYENEHKAGPIDKQTYRMGKKVYRATGSSALFSVNAKDGVIITMNVTSPKEAARLRHPPVPEHQLPRLNKWSDVAWLYCKGRVQTPHYLLSIWVVDQDTVLVIDEALARNRLALDQFPGAIFSPHSDEYKAILGSPIGQDLAYYLVRHKEDLSDLEISQIHIFQCNDERRHRCLLFKVLPAVVASAVAESDRSSADIDSQTGVVQEQNMQRLNDLQTEPFSRKSFHLRPRRRELPLNESHPEPAGDSPPPSPPPPPSAFAPPASDEVWGASQCKGNKLVRGMRMSDYEAGQQLFDPPRQSAQSQWMDMNDFYQWNWDEYEIQTPSRNFYGGRNYPTDGNGIGHVLTALGLSDRLYEDGGKISFHSALHGDPTDAEGNPLDKQTYQVNGKTYRATGASLTFALNTEQGAIIALDRLSPVNAAKDRKPPVPADQLPGLSRFSDIAYVFYRDVQGQSPKNLRYFMALTLTNTVTQSILHRALDNVEQTLGPWPGTTFYWYTDEFKAILGTPNANGFGWFLLQHKPALGNMFIEKVRVFYGDTWHQCACLLFVVLPVPPPEVSPSPSPSPPPAPTPAASAVEERNVGRFDAVRAKL